MFDVFGRDRAEVLADYVIETGATVRATAIHFGISKSTVHKDVTDTLKYVNKSLYYEVGELLLKNKIEIKEINEKISYYHFYSPAS